MDYTSGSERNGLNRPFCIPDSSATLTLEAPLDAELAPMTFASVQRVFFDFSFYGDSVAENNPAARSCSEEYF